MNFPNARRTKTPVPAPPEPLSPFGHYYEEVRRALEVAKLREVLDPAPAAPSGSTETPAVNGDVASSGRS